MAASGAIASRSPCWVARGQCLGGPALSPVSTGGMVSSSEGGSGRVRRPDAACGCRGTSQDLSSKINLSYILRQSCVSWHEQVLHSHFSVRPEFMRSRAAVTVEMWCVARFLLGPHVCLTLVGDVVPVTRETDRQGSQHLPPRVPAGCCCGCPVSV